MRTRAATVLAAWCILARGVMAQAPEAPSGLTLEATDSTAMASFSDNFDRANGSLGANWTNYDRVGATVVIASNQASVSETGYSGPMAAYTAQALAPDRRVRVRVYGVSQYPEIGLRFTNGSTANLRLELHSGTDGVQLVKFSGVNDGSDAVVIDNATLSGLTDGDYIGATVSGSGTSTTVRVWRNPTNTAPISASEWDASGDTPDLTFVIANSGDAVDSGSYVAIGGYAATSGTIRFDDISAGDLGGGGGTAFTWSGADTLGLSESSAGAAGFVRSQADAMALGDTVAGASSFVRAMADALALGETSSPAASFSRALADALQLDEAQSGALVIIVAIADALSLGDSPSAAASFAAAAADGLSLGETSDRSAAFASSISEAVVLADSYASAAALVRVLSDSLVLDELAAGQIIGSTLAAQVADALLVGDNVAAASAFSRALADALSLSDATTTAAVFAALISEGLNVGDALATTATIVRAVSDPVALGELVAGYLGATDIPALRGVITALRLRATIAEQRLRGQIDSV